VSDPSRFGLVWPAFGLAALASTLLASRVARGFEPRRVWIAAQLVMACGVAAPALAHSLGALLTSAVCVGGTFMVVTMAAMQQARQLAVHDAPRLMGAMTAAFAAGQLLGPLTVGPLVGGGLAGHDTVPWAASALAVAALCAGVAVLCPRAPRTHT
jgi:predicted MFS family arabinose efflux permease